MVRKANYHQVVHPLRLRTSEPRAVAASLPKAMSQLKQLSLFAALLLTIASIFISSALAQSSHILNSPEANALYGQLLDNPTDRSLNLKYSAMMSQGGDFEAAIPPLERMLVTEPSNAWLMLQLGTLYNALDSNVMAATYLTQAIHEPTASADVVSKANQLLSTL